MKTLYLDCGMGAAGDMLMAALLELADDKAAFLDKMNGLGLPGVEVTAQPSVKCGITGTHVAVTVNGQEEISCDVDSGAAPVHIHDHEHDHGHDHHHEHAHDHAHDHDHCHCHDHDHGEAVPDLDYAALGASSSTRAIYRIVNMDCPMEEALIRKKLASVSGITSLEFNLMQRVLTVNHELESTKVIEDALKAIDMTPEPIVTEGSLAVFSISGMDCPVEERLIRSKLGSMPGVHGLEFNLMTRTLKVRHADEALPAISAALASLNMGARLVVTEDASPAPIEAPKIAWKKLAFAGVLAAFSEVFHLMLDWQAQPFGIDVAALSIAGFPALQALALLFSVLAIALAGLTTYRKGWLAVSNFNLNMNALMSVAVTGAVLIGQFPEAAMVMVLFNLSEAIEAKSLDKARNAIKQLLALAPEKATVQQPDGTWVERDIREVAVGSIVRVRPGEKIALDGLVTSGHSTVNQAPITGESLPVEKKAGDTVFAGTINESGSFEFRVTALATNSTLSRIIHAVEEAQGSRGRPGTAPLPERRLDRVHLHGPGRPGHRLPLRPSHLHAREHCERHGRSHTLRHSRQGRHVPGTGTAAQVHCPGQDRHHHLRQAAADGCRPHGAHGQRGLCLPGCQHRLPLRPSRLQSHCEGGPGRRPPCAKR